ncbi:hypothetical protein ACFQZT_24835 [Paenibacillus sp. GCM10027628]|uniref:hypothetical protein n=1 Tax=Paenibacillus sp. GCM10027628 TaxID=3273413 RepID=UPI0036253A8F
MTKESNNQTAEAPNMKLFAGEKLLVYVGLAGFVLAGVIAIYIGLSGSVILPEGSAERAFSFNAAIAMFILSIAAILPLSGLSHRKRSGVRRFFIPAILFAYGVETVQQFRGINPRFSRIGSVIDSVVGALFGLDSLLIIVVTVLLAIPFFRRRKANGRPLVVLGIRYAFLSTMAAFAAGLWMIAISSRYTGAAGNLIVLHGLGFHALQALPLLGWLLEKARSGELIARRLIHTGSTAWLISVLLVGLQTAFGRTVFELTALPLLAGIMLLVWLGTFIFATIDLLKASPAPEIQTSQRH